jgi:hypothetical protein
MDIHYSDSELEAGWRQILARVEAARQDPARRREADAAVLEALADLILAGAIAPDTLRPAAEQSPKPTDDQSRQ